MFSKPEQRLLSDPYFQIVRSNESFYELQSRNTLHYWMIRKNYNAESFRIELHHKHKVHDYYHTQYRNVSTVKKAIRIIKDHDRYVLNLLHK